MRRALSVLAIALTGVGYASAQSSSTAAEEARPKAIYARNGERVDSLPPGYFSSTNFTHFTIQCIDEARTKGQPFFAYLSYQAPHGPLAAPEDWIDRYRGVCDAGAHRIGDARLARQKAMGSLND